MYKDDEREGKKKELFFFVKKNRFTTVSQKTFMLKGVIEKVEEFID